MFEIDLLKGKHRPQKTDLKRFVFKLLLLLVPIAATLAYAGGVRQDRIRLESVRQAVASSQSEVDNYRDILDALNGLRRQLGEIRSPLDEIAVALNYRQVSSTVLVELAACLPPDIVLWDMHLRRHVVRQRNTESGAGQAKTETIVKRSLRLTLCGETGSDSDTSVQAYLHTLRASPVLAPLVQEIRPAARQQHLIDTTTVTQYSIEIVLNDLRS